MLLGCGFRAVSASADTARKSGHRFSQWLAAGDKQASVCQRCNHQGFPRLLYAAVQGTVATLSGAAAHLPGLPGLHLGKDLDHTFRGMSADRVLIPGNGAKLVTLGVTQALPQFVPGLVLNFFGHLLRH